MVMKRWTAALFLVALLLLAPGVCAENSARRVYDEAALLTQEEAAELDEMILSFQRDTAMDFALWTTRAPRDEADMLTDADRFYEQHAFGLDTESSGAVLMIDMYNRIPSLSTAGLMIDYLTDERCDNILSAIHSDLALGNYSDAAQKTLRYIQQYVRDGIPEDQYRYDYVTGERLTARHLVLTAEEILISLAGGVAAALFFALIIRAKYHLKGGTYRYDYRAESDTAIETERDDLIRTDVRRIARAQSSGSGGRGGGFSGGSGVRRSSGGMSHGGRSGGRF